VTAPARSPQSPRLAPSGVACRPVETCDEGRSSARLKKPATALKQGRVLSGRKLAWSGRSDEGQSAGSPMVPDGMACAPRRSAGRPRFGSLVSGRPLKTAVSSQTSGEGGCSTLRTKTPPPWRRGNLEYCGPASMGAGAGPARSEFPWPQRDGIAARQEPADQHQVPLIWKKPAVLGGAAGQVQEVLGSKKATGSSSWKMIATTPCRVLRNCNAQDCLRNATRIRVGYDSERRY